MSTHHGGSGRSRRPRRRSAARSGPDGPLPGGAADDTPDADPEAVARAIVLRRLTAAPRSRAELAETLAGREVPDAVADAVLDRFEELGLVDDRAYAEMLVRSRHTGRGLARRALAQELRRRGVDDELAEEALQTLDPADEEATARRLVDRRLAGSRGMERQVRVRRLAGMLARKGYSSGVALRVVEQALDDESGRS